LDAKNDPASTIELSEAIEALRAALVRAWWDGQRSRVRFRVEPVELTIHAGVTKATQGEAGIRWHVLSLGGERSHQAETMQTLTLRLAPVLFDEQGNVLAEAEQLVSDRIDIDQASQEAGGADGEPSHEQR
jgi:Trypsin-co-occurring domain 2